VALDEPPEDRETDLVQTLRPVPGPD